MTTTTTTTTELASIATAVFPSAKIVPASELCSEWAGVAIGFGGTTYVAYPGESDDVWLVDTLTTDGDVLCDSYDTYGKALGAILASHLLATFGV